MDIATVARRAGVPASTLRFYEEKGLIASVGRHGLPAGFSLDEIGRMFATDGSPRIDRGLLSRKADELDLTIERLTALREGLRHAAQCPAPSHMECPTFRRLLAGASTASASRGKLPRRPRNAR